MEGGDGEEQTDQSIYSYVDNRIKEVCGHEIEKFRDEIFADSNAPSTANNANKLKKLQHENNKLHSRIREIESQYDSLRQEAKIISDENKSLATVEQRVVQRNTALDGRRTSTVYTPEKEKGKKKQHTKQAKIPTKNRYEILHDLTRP